MVLSDSKSGNCVVIGGVNFEQDASAVNFSVL
jgi:hypothetical protein